MSLGRNGPSWNWTYSSHDETFGTKGKGRLNKQLAESIAAATTEDDDVPIIDFVLSPVQRQALEQVRAAMAGNADVELVVRRVSDALSRRITNPEAAVAYASKVANAIAEDRDAADILTDRK